MKTFYFISSVLFANLLSAQYYSFEQAENFNLGPINQQNGWTVTQVAQGKPSLTQIVTNERAKTGLQSLKIDYDANAQFQPVLIMGAFKTLETPLDRSNFTVSFSGNIGVPPGDLISVFGYQAGSRVDGQIVNEIYFYYDGSIIILENAGDSSNNKEIGKWQPNTWYDFKIEGVGDKVNYYLNGELVYTGHVLFNIDEIRFTHDNYSGYAYFDDITIDSKTLSLNDISLNKDIFLFPNPILDFANIRNSSKTDLVMIFDMSGKKVHEIIPIGSTINLSHLKAGAYIVVIKTGDKTVKQKIIKK